MSRLRTVHGLPTHTQLTDFITAVLPIHPLDIPFAYHGPRNRSYKPSKSIATHVILGVTPTTGVYNKLQHLAEHERNPPLCFLHRPFGLNRQAIPRGTLILASHKRFDELLTVGYNSPLSTSLGLQLEDHAVLQGYKGDQNRLMGIVARLPHPKNINTVREDVIREFGSCEIFTEDQQISEITGLAIVNALNPEMVSRVAEAAASKGFVKDVTTVREVLYLTGQARQAGIEAAGALGMPIACVGHRASEEWGIRWLAARIKSAFPGVDVFEVFEDEDAPNGADDTLGSGIASTTNI